MILVGIFVEAWGSPQTTQNECDNAGEIVVFFHYQVKWRQLTFAEGESRLTKNQTMLTGEGDIQDPPSHNLLCSEIKAPT
jgi:hypothetical protein